MKTIFGASAMSNKQPPAANRQFREVVARICHLTASKRQGIDAPDSFFFSHGAPAPCVSIFHLLLEGTAEVARIARAKRRCGSMPRRTDGIGRGIGRAATMRCWLMVAGCWLLDIADKKRFTLRQEGESFLHRP
jgi:hypothetical protein